MRIHNKVRIHIILAVVLSFSMLTACNADSAGSRGTSESTREPSEASASVSVHSAAERLAVPPASENAGQPSDAIASDGTPVVYMTADISPAGLAAVYEALGREAAGNVAVKINTGEPGSKYYLSPDLIEDFVRTVNGTIVECNTISGYNGKRTSTAMHYQVAEDHGFTAIAPVLIMDEEGDKTIPVINGRHLTENVVGAHFADFDFHVVLSHFKGKASTGFGGAITNLSMGYASSRGKGLIHAVDNSGSTVFLETIAETAKSVADYAGDAILYINVMNNLSVDCDCRSNPAEPDMHDIGILASLDPVAIDQACVDLVYKAEGSASLVERIESKKGIHTLEYAEEIGLGSRQYELADLDD